MPNHIDVNFTPSAPVASSSGATRDSHIMKWTDSGGKEHFYRIRVYERTASGERSLIALTDSQWKGTIDTNMKKTLNKVSESTKDFFAGTRTFKLGLSDRGIDLDYSSKKVSLTHGEYPSLAEHFYKTIARLHPPLALSEKPKANADSTPKKAITASPAPEPAKLNAVKIKPFNAPPIGIRNEGDDCFINAYLQAFILDDPDLTDVLFNQKGDAAEFGSFLLNYKEAQERYKGALEGTEKPVIEDVHAIRKALSYLNNTPDYYESGQHDSTEAFDFLNKNNPTEAFSFLNQNLDFGTSHFQTETTKIYWQMPDNIDNNENFLETLKLFEIPNFEAQQDDTGEVYTTEINPNFNGTIPIIYKSDRSLENLLDDYLDTTLDKVISTELTLKGASKSIQWKKTPKHLTLTLTTKLELSEVDGTLTRTFPDGKEHTIELTSFIEHRGENNQSGHYVAYVKRGDKYFKCDDAKIKKISHVDFLKAAKNAYMAKYTFDASLAPAAAENSVEM